jgi:hypothetical protein
LAQDSIKNFASLLWPLEEALEIVLAASTASAAAILCLMPPPFLFVAGGPFSDLAMAYLSPGIGKHVVRFHDTMEDKPS